MYDYQANVRIAELERQAKELKEEAFILKIADKVVETILLKFNLTPKEPENDNV